MMMIMKLIYLGFFFSVELKEKSLKGRLLIIKLTYLVVCMDVYLIWNVRIIGWEALREYKQFKRKCPRETEGKVKEESFFDGDQWNDDVGDWIGK